MLDQDEVAREVAAGVPIGEEKKNGCDENVSEGGAARRARPLSLLGLMQESQQALAARKLEANPWLFLCASGGDGTERSKGGKRRGNKHMHLQGKQ